MNGRPRKPLGTTERKLVLLVELHVRDHGRGPSWGHLTRVLALDRGKVAVVLLGLRKKGMVEFADEVPGSIRATPRGVREAVGRTCS